MIKIPVLGYHSLHASNIDYCNNDHVALEEDIKLLLRNGFTIVSAKFIVDKIINKQWSNLKGRYAVLTFDDGPDIDFFDYEDSIIGYQKSFFNILKEHEVCGTSFVIASPIARQQLDTTCIAGRNEWRDCWWKEASQSGILDIANHSWDHNHESLLYVKQRDQNKGSFYVIDTFEDADAQIYQAEQYIKKITENKSAQLFAYPYGHTNNYLLNTYFPDQINRHGIKAAFTTSGKYVNEDTNRWKIPRFICGEHWRSPQQLLDIIKYC